VPKLQAPGGAELGEEHGADPQVLDRRERLVRSQRGRRDIDFVVSWTPRPQAKLPKRLRISCFSRSALLTPADICLLCRPLGSRLRDFPARCTKALNKKPSEYLRQLYFDSMVFTSEGLRHLIAEVGVSQIVIGTDYPFPWTKPAVDHILTTPG
jgi:hypothetical protein